MLSFSSSVYAHIVPSQNPQDFRRVSGIRMTHPVRISHILVHIYISIPFSALSLVTTVTIYVYDISTRKKKSTHIQ